MLNGQDWYVIDWLIGFGRTIDIENSKPRNFNSEKLLKETICGASEFFIGLYSY